MFDLFKKSTNVRCAALLDIGSGSVGVAIVKSDSTKNNPEIIWSQREYTTIADISDTKDTLKSINTALVNTFLELGSTGSKVLTDFDPQLKISEVQVAISAPWSYTVTKSVNFTDEHPFQIDEDTINSLIQTAKKQVKAAMKDAGLEIQGLEIINDDTINASINGYNLTTLVDQKGRTVSITHLTALSYKQILKTLRESIEKILPKAEIQIYSFIYVFYCFLKNIRSETTEICMIDITSEATEVGIVRDGVLKHITHIPYGTYTIVREITAACNIPKEEAYTYLKGGVSFVDTKFTNSQKDQLRAILSAYELKVSSMFKATGDELSIPKTVFLHTDAKTEEFFSERIKAAAYDATQNNHNIHLVTEKLMEDMDSADTAILLSAHHYHNDSLCHVSFD